MKTVVQRTIVYYLILNDLIIVKVFAPGAKTSVIRIVLRRLAFSAFSDFSIDIYVSGIRFRLL